MKKILITLSFFLGFFYTQANYDTMMSPDSLCFVAVDSVQNGFCFQATPTGVAPFTYLWNDGTTGSSTCMSPSLTEYCVTVTDATGCVAVGCSGQINPPTCSVWIFEQNVGTSLPLLSAAPTGVSPYTYSWNTGEATETITPTSAGEYCVTITDASGCVSEDCITVTTTCVATLTETSSGCFSATSSGTAPFTYAWSNGSTTETACFSNPNDSLCVVITDVNGCVAFGCVDVITTPDCDVQIAQNGGGLIANATGDAPFTYEWSTGETEAFIIAASSGTYCVTVTSSTGCQAYNCTTYQATDEISGYIYLDSLGQINAGVNDFKVYLIQNDATAGTLTAVDSQIVSSTPNHWGAFYSFTGLGNGDYLVKAAIEVGSAQYDSYLPTYYGDVLYWSDATTVSIPSTNAYKNIEMTVGVNPGGPGFIGGLISEGANFTSGAVETRGEGDPVANVNVLLLSATDEPIAHTITDANGEFSFPSLAYGTYKLVVEILGKTPGIKMITISADEPTVNVSFDVNETNVTKIEEVLNGASLNVFPNPVTNNMNIQIEIRKNVSLNVTVTNLLGETLVSDTKDLNEGIQTLNVNMNNLPTGIYFLNLSDGQEVISKKILKQ